MNFTPAMKFLFVSLFFLGFVYASGWHVASEILPGTFSVGDFIFNGGVTVGNTTSTTAGTIRWTGSGFQGYNGTTWLNLSGGGSSSSGAWSYVSTSTASATSSFDFTSLIADNYMLICNALLPVTDNVGLYLRVDSDNGASFETVDYQYGTQATDISSTGTHNGESGSASEIQVIAAGIGNAGSGSNEYGAYFVLWIMGLNDADGPANIRAHGSFQANDGDGHRFLASGMSADDAGGGATIDVDSFQIYMSSGNIASGTCHLYSSVTN